MSTTARKFTLFALAWPIFGENLLHTLVHFVDIVMVSRLSDDAAAAVGQAAQILWVAMILFTFIAVGASILVTHHLGAKDQAGADRISAVAIAANTWIGLLVSILLYVLARQALQLVQMPRQLQEVAMQFLPLMGGTLFLEAQNIAMSAVLRAHGHPRDPLWVVGVQNALNAAGNALLLFGLLGFPRLGVAGAALSGVLSRLVAFVIFWVLVRRRTGVRIRFQDYVRIPMTEISRILRIGLPSAGENLLWAFAFVVTTSFIARMGATALATQTYVMQIVNCMVLLGLSIGLANEILVGRDVGAGQFERAYENALHSLRTGFTCVCITVVPIVLLAPQLLSIFTNDQEIIHTGVVLLRMGLLLETGRIFNLVLVMSLRATGDALFPFLIGIVSMWGIWVPLAWVLGLKLGFGLPGIWVSMMTDEWFRGAVFFRRWRRRGWMAQARRSRASAEASAADSVLRCV